MENWRRKEAGEERREGAPLQPGRRMPIAVEGRLQVLVTDRVEIAELDVVLAGPLHPDGYAGILPGQKGRLDGVVRFGLTTKAATKQRHMDLDLVPDLPLEVVPKLDQR